MFEHVYSTTYLNIQTARVSAALPAAGAYDAAPLELACPGFKTALLSLAYTRGGAAGAFAFQVEISPASSGAVWHRIMLYSAPAVVPGSDAQSDIQREAVEYQATGAAIERLAFGPINLGGAVERIRIPAAETGNVGAPGTLEIIVNFGM